MNKTILLSAVTSTGAGDAVVVNGGRASFDATVVGTGAVTGTVLIQGSNDGTNWVTLFTFTLDGTTTDTTGGSEPDLAFSKVRANLTAVTGTDAAVTVNMGS